MIKISDFQNRNISEQIYELETYIKLIVVSNSNNSNKRN